MKNSREKNKRSVVLLDFASEKNRGDAAMQVSILELARKHFSDCNISVLTIFGTNQFPDALGEFDHTNKLLHEHSFFGGLIKTHENISDKYTVSGFAQKSLKLLFIFKGLFLITLLFCKVPKSVTNFFLNKKEKKSFEVLDTCDFVIWNGRNIRSYKPSRELFDLFPLVFHPLICIALNKPMVCVGTSVWKLENGFASAIVGYVFTKCKLVTARESFSFDYVNKISNKVNLIQLPDLSLYTLSQINYTKNSFDKYSFKSKNKRIFALTIVGTREIFDFEKRQIYIKKLRQIIDFYINKEYYLVITPQVIFGPEDNSDVTLEVLNQIPTENYTHITESMSVNDLVEVYRQCDFLVASRMHSAIFALSAGVPVVSLAYDFGAKWDILVDIGLPREFIVDIDDLRSSSLINLSVDLLNNRERIMNDIKKNLNLNLYKKSEEHLSLARGIFDTIYDKR